MTFVETPTYRHYRGIVLRIMYGCADGVNKTLIAVGGKVYNDLCFRGDSTDYHDVELNLSICGIRGITTAVLTTINRDIHHLWRESQLTKICIQIIHWIATAKLDYCYT